MKFPFACLVALLAMLGCSASRSDEIGSECITDSQCSSGALCESGRCTSTAAAGVGANITGKVAGAPDSVEIASKASDDEVCEQRQGKGLVCALDPGDKLTLIAPVVEGYRFKGWTGKDGCTSSEPTLKLTKVERSTTCTANYVKRVVVSGAVAGEEDGEASVLASSESPFASCEGARCEVDLGGTVLLAAPERDGFRITGFEGDGCDDRDGYRVTVSEAQDDITCIASYIDSLTVRGQIQGVPPEVLRTLSEQIVASSPAEDALCAGQVCAIDTGNAVTLVAPLIDKYRFRGWTGDTPCLGAELTVELGDVTTNVLCTADYVARFEVSGESEGADAPMSATSENLFSGCDGAHCTVDSGESVTLHAGTVDGYRLKNWSGEGCEPLSGASAIARDVTNDVVCTAHYVEGVSVTGTVINAEGEVEATSDSPGADCGRGSCAIDIGGTVTLIAPSLPGRTFLGWSGDAGCTSSAPSVTLNDVTTSKSCNATFAARYTVTSRAVPAAGGQVTATSASRNAACSGPRCEVDEGSTVTLNAVANPSYRFTGWSGGGPCMGSAPRLDLNAVKASVTCSATFVARIKVGGAVTPSNGGTVTARQVSLSAQCAGPVCTVDSGTDVVLTATPSTGYEFSRWTGCGSSFNPLLSSNPLLVLGPTSDTTCTVSFSKKTYPVSAVAGAGGSVSASSGGSGCANATCIVEYGGSAVLSASPSSGYEFTGWSGCSISPSGTVGNVTMAQTCSASFSKIRYAVTALAGPGGEVTASTGGASCAGARCMVEYGGSVELTAREATGYDFSGWSGCTVSTAGTVSNVRMPLTCTANFIKERYSLTGESVGAAVAVRATSTSPGSQCSGNSCTVDYGTGVTLTVPATDPRGVRFEGWQACTGARINGRSLTVDALASSYTCRASYAALPQFTVTTNVDGPGTASCLGSCTVFQGESVDLTATPKPRPTDASVSFDGWVCDGQPVPGRVDNLQRDITCTAKFSAVPIVI